MTDKEKLDIAVETLEFFANVNNFHSAPKGSTYILPKGLYRSVAKARKALKKIAPN